MTEERLDRKWAWRSCDGWPQRDVWGGGPATWPVCREPVVVVVWDQETDSYSGLCAAHNAERRRLAR